jgi:hypothetical protein
MDPSKKTGDEVWYSRNVSSVCFLSDTRRQIRKTEIICTVKIMVWNTIYIWD